MIRVWMIVFVLGMNVPLSAGEGVWVGVGYGGRRICSIDGKEWKITAEWAQPGGDDANNLMSVAFGRNKFVAVGGGGGGPTGGGHILISRDGHEWKEVLTDKSRINPVVFGDGKFVVGTSSYPSGKLLTSEDGEEWTAGAKIAASGLTHFRGGAYGNGRFVLVGNGTVKSAAGENKPIHWAVSSTDGKTIAAERTDLPGHGRIVFGAGRFLMLTSHSNADLIGSTDGVEWSPVHPTAGAKWNWLVWTGREFLVGDGKGTFRSSDGIEWAKAELISRADVLWSDGRHFITTSWPGKMGYSTDGVRWIASPPMTENGINAVVYGEIEAK